MVKNKWIQKYIGLAICLNALVFIVLIFLSVWFSNFITNIIQNYLTNTNGFLLLTINFFLWLIIVVFIIQIFGAVTSVVNSPVYSILTSKIIEKEFPHVTFPQSNFALEIYNALIFELKKLLLSGVIIFLSFFINIIPIIGTILYFFILVLQLIFITALDTFEAFHSLKKLSFRNRLSQVCLQPCKYWPFLAISGLIGSIPLLNIFLLPVSIVGACELMKNEFGESNSSEYKALISLS